MNRFLALLLIQGLLTMPIAVSAKEQESESDAGCSYGKWMLAAGVGVGTVVAAPVVLTGFGFTSAGVAAGSIAAAVQGPTVASGGAFAMAQSAGAAGLAATTKAVIASGVTLVTLFPWLLRYSK